MSNWETAERAYQTALNSSGSAEKEFETAMDSIEAKINQFKASFESLSQTIMSSDFLKGFIDFGTNALSVLDSLINKLGGLGTAAAGIGAVFGLTKGSNILNWLTGGNGLSGLTSNFSKFGTALSTAFQSAFSNINISSLFAKSAYASGGGISGAIKTFFSSMRGTGSSFLSAFKSNGSGSSFLSNLLLSDKDQRNIKSAFDYAKNLIKEESISLKEAVSQAPQLEGLSDSAKNIVSSFDSSEAAIEGFGSAMVKTTAKTVGLKVAMAALGAISFAALAAGISWVTNKIKDAYNAQKDWREEALATGEEASTSLSSITTAKADYDTALSQFKAGKISKDELTESATNLAEALGYEGSEIDNLVSKYGSLTSAMQAVVDESYEIERAKNLSELNDSIQAAAQDIYDRVGSTRYGDQFTIAEKGQADLASSFQNYLDKAGFETRLDRDKGNEVDYTIKLSGLDGSTNIWGQSNGADVESILTRYSEIQSAMSALREGINVSYSEDELFNSSTWKLLDTELEKIEGYDGFAEMQNQIKQVNASNITSDFENLLNSLNDLDNFDLSTASFTDVLNKLIEQAGTAEWNDKFIGGAAFLTDGFAEALGQMDEYKAAYQEWIGEITAYDADSLFKSLDFNLDKAFELKPESGKAFKAYVDEYIDEIELLTDALNELDTGKISTETFDKLIDKFPELANETDDLHESIRQIMDDLEGDMEKSLGSVTLNDEEAMEKIESIKAALSELKDGYVNGITFDLDIAQETTDLTGVYTALNEANGATGLSADSLALLKTRYKQLEGYDMASLFEHTANGMSLNSSELRKLESQYEKLQLKTYTNKLEALRDSYSDLAMEIQKAENAGEDTSKMLVEQSALKSKIEDAAALVSQYQGLTSSFNQWASIQDTQTSGYMYDTITDAKDTLKDYYDKGLVGNEIFTAGVQLMTDKDISGWSSESIADLYVEGAAAQNRYFTDGATGCEKFLQDVMKVQDTLGETWVQMDQNGEYKIDFGVGGDEKVAKAISDMAGLEISTEEVQAVLRKLSEYGFDIDLDSALSEFDNLKSAAEEAEYQINKLREKNGQETLDFNFEADSSSIDSEIAKAQELYDSYINPENGTLNIFVDGAEEAQAILAALIARKQELEQPAIMSIDTSTLSGDVQTGVQAIQDLQTAANRLEILKATGGSASQITEQIGIIKEQINTLNNLDPEIKAQLSIDDYDYQTLLEGMDQSEAELHVDAALETANALSQLAELTDDQFVDLIMNGDPSQVEELLSRIQKTDCELLLKPKSEGGLADDETSVDMSVDLDRGVYDEFIAEVEGHVVTIPMETSVNGKSATDVTTDSWASKDVGDTIQVAKTETVTLEPTVDTAKLEGTDIEIPATVVPKTTATGTGGGNNLLTLGESEGITVEVGANTDPATQTISNLTELANKPKTVKVEADTSEAKAEIDGISGGNGASIDVMCNLENPLGDDWNIAKELGVEEQLQAELTVDADTSELDAIDSTPRDVQTYLDADTSELDAIDSTPRDVQTYLDVYSQDIDELSNRELLVKTIADLDDSQIEALNDYMATINAEVNVDESEVDNLTTREQIINAVMDVDASTLPEIEDYVAKVSLDIDDSSVKSLAAEMDTFTATLDVDASELESLSLKDFSVPVHVEIDESQIDNIGEGQNPVIKARVEVDDSAADSISFSDKTITVGVLYDVAEAPVLSDQTISIHYLTDTAQPDSYQAPTPESPTVTYLKDSTIPDSYRAPTPPSPTVTFLKNSSAVDNYVPPNKTATVTYNVVVNGEVPKATGTAFAGGSFRAFASGKNNLYSRLPDSWKLKDSGVALMGELGPELIVNGNTARLAGEDGAEFAPYKSGDIIFNASQTEELLKKGYIHGRGRLFGNGSNYALGSLFDAFSKGSGGFYKTTPGVTTKSSTTTTTTPTTTTTTTATTTTYTPTTTSTSTSSDDEEEEEEPTKFDWVERLLDNIERAIEKIERKVENTFDTFLNRNEAAYEEVSAILNQIDTMNDSYDTYIAQANSVGLSEDIAVKVREGTLAIEEYEEETADLIDEYIEWYDKALDVADAIEDATEKMRELYKTYFENIKTNLEAEQDLYDFLLDYYDLGNELLSESGWWESNAYTARKIVVYQEKQDEYNQKLADLIDAMSTAMQDGVVVEGSEEWYNMQTEINEVRLAIRQCDVEIAKLNNEIEDLNLEQWEYALDLFDKLNDEADFFIELFSYRDMYDSSGNLTNEGWATAGLRGQKYNQYMVLSDEYGDKVEEINYKIAADPNNKDLITQKYKYLELQQQAILNAEKEKDALRDLIEEGYEQQKDALDDIIEKYKDALDQELELYSYQKKINEQTKNIATLEKQIASYGNDDSEETQAKVQKLKVSLEEAKEDLNETEYEHMISEEKKMLDQLSLDFETLINSRMDTIDAQLIYLLNDVNNNSAMISETLQTKADELGYTMTDYMQEIWNDQEGTILAWYNNGWVRLDQAAAALQSLETTLSTDDREAYKNAMNGAVDDINGTIKDYFAGKFGEVDARFNTSNVSLAIGNDQLSKCNSALTTIQGILNQIYSLVDKQVHASDVKAVTDVTETSKTTEPVKQTTTPATKKPSTTVKKETPTIGVGSLIKVSADEPIYATGTGGIGQWGTHQYFASDPLYYIIGESDGYYLVRWHGTNTGQTGWFKKSAVSLASYKTGGIVYNTGPAWLDGTPTRPEAVLNAEDTANLLALTELMRASSLSSSIQTPDSVGSFGSSIGSVNMNIEIDHVEDYDDFVKQLQNDPQFESMISDMTINKLNGKSGLNKYKYYK